MKEKIARMLFRKTVERIENRAYAHGQEVGYWNLVKDSERNTITVWEDPWDGRTYRLGVVEESNAPR